MDVPGIAERLARSLQNPTHVRGLAIPQELRSLISSGRWPVTSAQLRAQNSTPIVPMSRVHALAPNEPGLFFLRPPFKTIRDQLAPSVIRWHRTRPEINPQPGEFPRFIRPRFMGFEECIPSFWEWPDSAPGEIDFDLAIDIGDFGMGSDSPIILDYRADRTHPCVKHLRWGRKPDRSPDNHWVQLARSFAEFASALGLEPKSV